ncbi:MAG: stage II sporulation protein M [Dethiobacter sp.]|nr:stage II sporulation protein M [Dethiobacter sp.]
MVNRIKLVFTENRSWLFLATTFFFLGYILSYSALSSDPALFNMLEETAFPLLRDLGDRVFSGNPIAGTLILFFHNLTASLQVIILGFILGIPALFSTLANGTLLGAVVAHMANEGILPLQLIIISILPHGMFELPAFLLSAALGLKLGYHVVFPLPGQGRKETIVHIFREIKNAFPAIVLLLAVAAMLEVFVTPGLVRNFLLNN